MMRQEQREQLYCFLHLYRYPASHTVCVCLTASKRDHLVNNLQNLSVSDRGRMLREIPLSVAEKSHLR